MADDGITLVHWCPAGAIGCFATSRFFPGRSELPREERQLVSLQTRRWHYRGVGARGSSLTFVRDGAWASVAPTWHPDGRFVHWYVNFQLPMVRHVDGYETLDLVLDIVVEPDGSWRWKDRGPFEAAIQRNIFDAEVADAVEHEARRIQEEIAERSGPFDPRWSSWSAPAEWTTPVLHSDFAGRLKAPANSVITLDDQPAVR